MSGEKSVSSVIIFAQMNYFIFLIVILLLIGLIRNPITYLTSYILFYLYCTKKDINMIALERLMFKIIRYE